MDEFQSLKTNRLPTYIMNNSIFVDEEHVCKLILYFEIPSIK